MPLDSAQVAAEKRREFSAEWLNRRQRASRDVKTDAVIKDPKRRRACRRNLKKFLLEYTPGPFEYPFGKAHLALIKDIQDVILTGKQICAAMPRGSGKSTLMELALVWSCVYGHRKFPIIVSANSGLFTQSFASIKTTLRFCEALAEDFPEIIGPIREIDDKAVRIKGQHWGGEDTHMQWSAERIRFPNNPVARKRGNAAICLGGGGLTGALRGTKSVLSTGEVVRPDCLLFDDVQTTESAESLAQTDSRERLVYDCLAMKGPGKSMAALMACTVIAPNDLSDRLLSVERPEWISHRSKTLEAFPDNMDEWQKYNDVRRHEHLGDVRKGSANAYYRKHRKILEKGAKHYWPGFKAEGKVSRIQEAMDIYFENSRHFYAEYQNDPQPMEDENSLQLLDPLALVKRTKPIKQSMIPAECTTVTAHVDVQGEIMFFCVVSWTEAFGGHVMSYGTWPKWTQQYFQLHQVKKGPTLSKMYPNHDDDARVSQGVIDVIRIIDRDWEREGGTKLRPRLILVDHGWKPAAVERGIRDSGCGVALAAKGFGIGAARAPMALWPAKPGERRGDHWVTRPVRQQARPLVEYDTNYWKTQLHAALTVPEQNATAVTLFKGTAAEHQMFCDHLCAERAVKVEAMGRVVAEWLNKKAGTDNHYFDTLVGAMAGASMCGIAKFDDHDQSQAPPSFKVRRGTAKPTYRR